MAFKHLEDRLPMEQIENFLKIFDKLREPTKTTLGYTLDIAAFLEDLKLSEQHNLFGGYAVLTHLVSAYSEPIMLSWRGSSDIDMNGSKNVLHAIKGEYIVISDRASPNIEDKRTVKIKNAEEGEVKIDYVNDQIKENSGVESHCIFGIPVRVVNPIDLIRSKARLAKEERAHLEDVISLLGVLDLREVLPENVTQSLETEVKHELYDILVIYETASNKARLSIGPSKEYTSELKRELKRYK